MKKISVFTLLLCFLFLFHIPVKTYAAETDDLFYEWCSDNGLPTVLGYTFDVAGYENIPVHYVVFYDSLANRYKALRVYSYGDVKVYADGTSYVSNIAGANHFRDISILNSGSVSWVGSSKSHSDFKSSSTFSASIFEGYEIVFSTLDIYSSSAFDSLLYEKNELFYSFSSWCDDAGLNCKASSNESSSVIPYSVNSYWHIVRRTYDGKWLLTTIGNSLWAEEFLDYTLLVSEDQGYLRVWNLYSGEDPNGYLINSRQYVYDTDGWRLLSFYTDDAREDDDCIIDLGAGSGFDDTKVLAYTNTNIYAEDGLEVVYAGSTDYYDPQPEEPEVTATPTPTSTPAGGGSGGDPSGGGSGGGTRPEGGGSDDNSSDSGSGVGSLSSSGGLSFIVNLFKLIWTEICSIPMAVDGYSISIQQIIVYGALVAIVGGFLLRFIFKR